MLFQGDLWSEHSFKMKRSRTTWTLFQGEMWPAEVNTVSRQIIAGWHERCFKAKHSQLKWTLFQGKVWLADANAVSRRNVAGQWEHYSWPKSEKCTEIKAQIQSAFQLSSQSLSQSNRNCNHISRALITVNPHWFSTSLTMYFFKY